MGIRPRFDFSEYVREKFDCKFQQSDKTQASIHCINPDCEDHWRQRRKMTVSLKYGKAFCFVCGTGYNMAGFVAAAEGISRFEAMKMIAQQELPRTYGTGRLEKALETLSGTEGPGVEKPAKPEPCSFPAFTRGVFPGSPEYRYLQDRRISQQVIDHFGLKFAPVGRYAGRIIIPILKDGVPVSFQGRTIYGSKPKYLFPVDQPFDSEIYNWDDARHCARIIVTEGVTSAWRVWEFGYKNVVATFGKSLKIQQERAIKAAENVKEIVMLWDGGTLPEAYAAGLRLAGTKRVWIAQLPGSLDPDECPETPEHIKAATPIEGIDRMTVALSKLSK